MRLLIGSIKKRESSTSSVVIAVLAVANGQRQVKPGKSNSGSKKPSKKPLPGKKPTLPNKKPILGKVPGKVQGSLSTISTIFTVYSRP